MATSTPRQRRSEHRARNGNMVDMNLVSLIDVFTILIFFLLSSAAGVEVLVSPKAVNLPIANAEKPPRPPWCWWSAPTRSWSRAGASPA
jgi:biopolymer transport protein ExbD